MVTKDVIVSHAVRVTVDESKFTPEFMMQFRASMYPFQTVDDHIEHLAQLYARGVIDSFTRFVEGYGPPAEFGIKCVTGELETEIA